LGAAEGTGVSEVNLASPGDLCVFLLFGEEEWGARVSLRLKFLEQLQEGT